MLKKLVARHRVLKLGATLVGASVLAVGFASPAFAFSPTVPTGGNANSANYNICRGWLEHHLPDDAAAGRRVQPGAGLRPGRFETSTQPLDYGCPGLNGEAGTTLSHDVVTNITGNTTSGSTSVTNVSSLTGIFAGQAISGTGDPGRRHHQEDEGYEQDHPGHRGDADDLERQHERHDDPGGR